MLRSFSRHMPCTLFVVLCLMLMAQQGSTGQDNTQKIIPVVVSIMPQKFLVERIGGEYVQISVLVKPGASPHSYEPTASQVTAIAQASLFFSIGMPFEDAWIPRLRNTAPNLQICSLQQSILPILEAMEKETEAAGHEHSRHDPHIWLSPQLMQHMAVAVKDALAQQLPEQNAYFTQRLQNFTAEIDALDTELQALFAPIPQAQRVFLTFHPAWEYFAHTYALQELSIEVDAKEPSPKTMVHIIKTAQEKGIRNIFIEPQFSPAAAQAIAQSIPASVVYIDPLSEDWANNLRSVAQSLYDACMNITPN